jgi:hypothetical protein
MSVSTEARSLLAARQADLVAALVQRGQSPAGFDAARLEAAAAALLRKRTRGVARAWPGLARSLGDEFSEPFLAYAQECPLPGDGAPLVDGRFFAKWLTSRRQVPDSGRLEVLAFDLRYAVSKDGIVCERRLALKWTSLHQQRRLVIACRLPWFGEHWWSMPMVTIRTR